MICPHTGMICWLKPPAMGLPIIIIALSQSTVVLNKRKMELKEHNEKFDEKFV